MIKVQINCEKCLRKAMHLIASIEGVESIAVEGEDKDHFIIIGDGIDLIILTKSLRKKFKHAEIMVVEPLMNLNVEISASMNNEANLENGFSQWRPNYPLPSQVIMYEEPIINSGSCLIM
ncbi:hypothetical protein MA16_Dca017268 [Dendrobium catenatum]|uniref:HMA domain-containing protein n=2 Tax=Dendrobium catenatum TaxID=906689 RepID=A0A2I0VU49_9ASPA|nr:hypothetical protein MA16_Dca017268 [Dendrobium catenatum]